jgi:hypothetical protein
VDEGVVWRRRGGLGMLLDPVRVSLEEGGGRREVDRGRKRRGGECGVGI